MPPNAAGPRPETEGTANIADGDRTIVTSSTDLPGLTREQMQQWHNWLADSYSVDRARLGYVALVETKAGHYRRRVYLALDSAHRAVQRAAARDLDARVILCELRALGGDS